MARALKAQQGAFALILPRVSYFWSTPNSRHLDERLVRLTARWTSIGYALMGDAA